MGRRSSDEQGRYSKLPTASRQASADGCHSRHRATRRPVAPGNVEWSQDCRVGGAHRVTPNEIAATFTNLLGRPVKVEAVPRETWESLFKSQGMKNPAPRIQMLDGFNEGSIEFEAGQAGSRKGNVAMETVLRMLIERERNL